MTRKIDLGRSLKSVGDDYVGRHPGDFPAVREHVERRVRRRRLLLAAQAATAVAAVAAIAVVAYDPPQQRALRPANQVPATLTVDYELSLPERPYQVTAKEDTAFITSTAAGTVSRVDRGAGDVVWTYDEAEAPEDIVWKTSALWFTDPALGQVIALDPRTGRPFFAPITVEGGPPVRLSVGPRAIWLSLQEGGSVRIPLPTPSTPTTLYDQAVVDIARGNRSFWILTATGSIIAIDPESGVAIQEVAPVSVPPEGEITFARGSIWYGRPGDATLIKIDEATGDTSEVELPAPYLDMDADRDGFWILTERSRGSGEVVELNPTDGSIGPRRITLDGEPVDLAASRGGIWVVLADDQKIVHLR